MSPTAAATNQRFDPNSYPLTPGVRLLEASAGTGKTFALAHLVLRLVVEQQLPLDQLLVVTFTEAAADELRDRIGRRLDGALQGLMQRESNQAGLNSTDAVLTDWLERHGHDSGQRRTLASRLLEALEALERADITTIHGFCRRTLRRQALQSGQALELSLDDDPQTLAQDVAHDLWREHVLGLAPADLAGLLKAGLNADALTMQLQRLDGDCAVSIASDAEPIEPAQPLAEAFEGWMQRRWSRFCAQWRDGGTALEQAFRACSAEWRDLGCKETKPFSPKPRKDRSQELETWLQHILVTFRNTPVTLTCASRHCWGAISTPEASKKPLGPAGRTTPASPHQICRRPSPISGMVPPSKPGACC